MKTLIRAVIIAVIVISNTACSSTMKSGTRDKILIGGAVIAAGVAIFGNQNNQQPKRGNSIDGELSELVYGGCETYYPIDSQIDFIFNRQYEAYQECEKRATAYQQFKDVYAYYNSYALEQNNALQSVINRRYNLERSGGNADEIQGLKQIEADLIMQMSQTDLYIRDWQMQLSDLQRQYNNAGGQSQLSVLYQYHIGAAAVYVPII